MEFAPALRDMECFVRVAEWLSFSRAADDLGVSQPAVSQAVARLERMTGVRLFERSSREVQLTDAGKVLLPYAEELLAQARAFAEESARLAAGPDTTIRLAYCPLVGSLAALVARRVANRTPAVELELRPAGWSVATADLAQGVVVAAIMAEPFPANLPTTARFQLPLTQLAVPPSSRVASLAAVRLDGLGNLPLLLPRTRPRGSVWNQLANQHTGPTIAADWEDLPAALDLVAAGRGALVVPRLLAETTRRLDVTFVPLAAATPTSGAMRLTYGLVWRPELGPAGVSSVVQTVQEILRASPARP